MKNNFILLRKLGKLVKNYVFGFYKNIYRTRYDKNVLISYITSPLRKKGLKIHSNFLELEVIVEVFKNLQFNIDVADYTFEGRIDYSKYDLIFGFGFPFGNAFYNKNAKKAKKICYMTGSMELFNQMKRIKYFRERHNKVLFPRRNYYWPFFQESIAMSDAIIVTGNKWTESTIKPYNSQVFRVRLPVFLPDKEVVRKDILKKEFEKAKKNFLWFGSSGALHKGLDLCLDVFSRKEDLFLHICGPINQEVDFFEFYRKELTELKNIKYYGFVNIDSALFKNIVMTCAFVIFPSCSEGVGGSVLTCASHGLIPIVTKESGVDIDSSYGFLLQDYKVEYISQVIDTLVNFPEERLRDMSLNAIEFTHKNHNKDVYKQDLLKVLKSLRVG